MAAALAYVRDLSLPDRRRVIVAKREDLVVVVLAGTSTRVVFHEVTR